MRLIDVDALKELLGGVRAYYNCFDEDEKKFYEAYSKAIEILNIYLDDEPTVDAIEVVRCCDCIHYDDDEMCHVLGHWMENDNYCKFGDRRTE